MPPNMPSSLRYGSIQVHPDEPEEGRAASATQITIDDYPEKACHSIAFPTRGIFAFLSCALFLLVWFAYSDTKHGPRPKIYKIPDASKTSSPDVELFYKHQWVDHFDEDNDEMYLQRYFEDRSFFKGPGHPIFVVMGGEDPIEKIIYPWISRHLAKTYGAVTICPEHRFYGKSQPIAPDIVTDDDFIKLLHPRQALADAVKLILHLQRSLGCGPRGSPTYCPVMVSPHNTSSLFRYCRRFMATKVSLCLSRLVLLVSPCSLSLFLQTIGGSYPGFLSVLMRTAHSDVVDIGYGASAPLHLYSHYANDEVYFDKITSVVEAHSPGCAEAVKETLAEFQAYLKASDKWLEEEAADIGICLETIPDYIDNPDILQQEVIMVIAEHFAENNMGFYPPGPDKQLVEGCKIFQQDALSSYEKIKLFLGMRREGDECFDLVTELPPGLYGTISGSDWSGVGGAHAGYMWDYQSCTLIPECSLGPDSMFPPRKWTLAWLTDHCERRFGYTPHPSALVDEFGFEDLSDDSRIIFTNGFNDGWYVLSVTANVSDTIVAFNFENGSHHSDLTHTWTTDDEDTPDIVEGHKRVERLVGMWLADIMNPDTN